MHRKCMGNFWKRNIYFWACYSKLQEVTVSFIMFFRLSARNRLSHIGWIFVTSDIRVFINNLIKIEVLLKSDKNNRCLT